MRITCAGGSANRVQFDSTPYTSGKWGRAGNARLRASDVPRSEVLAWTKLLAGRERGELEP